MNSSKINKNIVLIADRVDNFKGVGLSSDNLELIEDRYFEDIYDGLSSICHNIIYYNSPASFLENITQHKNDIVFSIWSGRKSRNRRALIPSICEAYGICYVGADTYANIICQDKILSKKFSLKNGINTPNYFFYEGSNLDELLINNLKLPIVIKPNFEGGSIGISKDCLVNSYKETLSKVSELFSIFKQPILIEEFAKGKEVSIVIMGNQEKILFCEVVELFIEDNAYDLENNIFSFEVKKENSNMVLSHRLITHEFSNDILNNAMSLFKNLGKVEELRIDGRYDGKDFYLIELSPDIHFGKGATFADAFNLNGIKYTEMLRMILLNTENYNNQLQ
ncbi:MAG: ATP-grasp domain-containing protein [Bacteroidales bacterium]|jgi:D-alanine-D-alanine ligase|nr:ATP-grasp domain-containing protein [Bacteroidales bacterium]